MMRIAVAAVLLFAAAVAPPAQPTPPPLEVEVSVHPSTDEPYQLLSRATPATFTCSALVSEPGTRHVWAAPQLVVAAAHSESITVKAQPFDVRFTVLISSKSDRAEADVTITRDGHVLNRQRSLVSLPGVRAGIVPVR